MFSTLWGDIRYAARIMGRAPLFTVTAVLTVAIAIAANATIFTVVNAVMIRSLPFAAPNGSCRWRKRTTSSTCRPSAFPC
jgi:hypothetical protein